MKKQFLATTFSPAMLKEDSRAFPHGCALIQQITLDEAVSHLEKGFISIVGHEVTAKILTALLGIEIGFNRNNLSLERGDRVIVVIPNFRAEQAREFDEEEVKASGFRCFLVDAI